MNENQSNILGNWGFWR